MNTLIFRTIAPFLAALMLVFSVFVLLRGHNEPGGGFIGGLIAASAFAIQGLAQGVSAVRRALKMDPLGIAAIGLLLSALAGFLPFLGAMPFMTGLWIDLNLVADTVPVSSVMLFDIGVYLVVAGTVTAIALALEEKETD
ncbi:Na+/H+ antiporter subunit B [Gellertiella hungarica]|uniref:Multicomponent Na+:H+ antiporter subunit B n=1 Tax=Gellertiella hungarica TaxID=1572859 RepID=A0A7W6J6N4_9HYPH|nr:Na+/H+ antiporter subunit B [Gellertiella hungarica]MBB4065764.1 multicomponent Na+:H+ antiporter subunit B [Gellertiella hungarica]